MHLGGKIVERAHAVPVLKQFVSQVRADKTGAPGDENLFAHDLPFKMNVACGLPNKGCSAISETADTDVYTMTSRHSNKITDNNIK